MIRKLLVEPALACSMLCTSTFAEEGGLLQPGAQSVDVPVDAQIVVASLFDTPRLFDADGTEVEVEVHPFAEGDGLRLVPTADLAPGTTFSVVLDPSTEVGTFTTGDRRVEGEIPVPTGLEAFGSVKRDAVPGSELRANCGGSNEGVLLHTTWERTTDLYEVQVIREDGSELVLPVGDERIQLGWSVPCVETVPGLRKNEEVEIRVRSLDLLGRPGEWSEPLVTRAGDFPGTGCSTLGLGGSGVAGVLLAAGLVRRRARPGRQGRF